MIQTHKWQWTDKLCLASIGNASNFHSLTSQGHPSKKAGKHGISHAKGKWNKWRPLIVTFESEGQAIHTNQNIDFKYLKTCLRIFIIFFC